VQPLSSNYVAGGPPLASESVGLTRSSTYDEQQSDTNLAAEVPRRHTSPLNASEREPGATSTLPRKSAGEVEKITIIAKQSMCNNRH
jgi:hypothetical protein